MAVGKPLARVRVLHRGPVQGVDQYHDVDFRPRHGPVITPDLAGWERKDEDEYAHVRRLGIVSDAEHHAVDDARAQAPAVLPDRVGVFAHAERWAARAWETAWPTPRLPRSRAAADMVVPEGG